MTTLLTFIEAQAVLRVPRSTLFALLARHNVKRVKLGKRVMFREQDIEGLINACLTPKRVPKF